MHVLYVTNVFYISAVILSNLVEMSDLVTTQTICWWMSWEESWYWKLYTRHRRNSTCLMRRYFHCFLCNTSTVPLMLVC